MSRVIGGTAEAPLNASTVIALGGAYFDTMRTNITTANTGAFFTDVVSPRGNESLLAWNTPIAVDSAPVAPKNGTAVWLYQMTVSVSLQVLSNTQSARGFGPWIAFGIDFEPIGAPPNTFALRYSSGANATTADPNDILRPVLTLLRLNNTTETCTRYDTSLLDCEFRNRTGATAPDRATTATVLRMRFIYDGSQLALLDVTVNGVAEFAPPQRSLAIASHTVWQIPRRLVFVGSFGRLALLPLHLQRDSYVCPATTPPPTTTTPPPTTKTSLSTTRTSISSKTATTAASVRTSTGTSVATLLPIATTGSVSLTTTTITTAATTSPTSTVEATFVPTSSGTREKTTSGASETATSFAAEFTAGTVVDTIATDNTRCPACWALAVLIPTGFMIAIVFGVVWSWRRRRQRDALPDDGSNRSDAEPSSAPIQYGRLPPTSIYGAAPKLEPEYDSVTSPLT